MNYFELKFFLIFKFLFKIFENKKKFYCSDDIFDIFWIDVLMNILDNVSVLCDIEICFDIIGIKVFFVFELDWIGVDLDDEDDVLYFCVMRIFFK